MKKEEKQGVSEDLESAAGARSGAAAWIWSYKEENGEIGKWGRLGVL